MKKIAIIGAGASGLPAIKCCLDEGLTPVCLERSDDIGGLWNYRETVSDGQSCVMRSTIINTSKEMMSYSDFPIPEEFPNFMHNTKVQEYFRMYAKHFDLLKYIRFRTEVVRVRAADDFATSGRWELTLRNLKQDGDATHIEIFDGVLVCTGHHAEKYQAHFDGEEQFAGRRVHTHDYRDHRGYEGKRVVIIGIGNSGGDVAVELGNVCQQAYLSTRRGSWVLNRIGDNGAPLDFLAIRRALYSIVNLVPSSVKNWIVETKLNRRFDHRMYGLRPEHRFDAQHPMVNDDLPNRIASGKVIIKPDVRRITRTGVEFEDGSVADNIDVIIYATGYKFGFPFIDHSAFEVRRNEVNLYKWVLAPDVRPATIAVLGCIQPLGSVMPISELQCRWALRVFKGDVRVASPDEMWQDVRDKQTAMKRQYVASQRHTIQVDYLPYMDELAELAGCKPHLGNLLLSDPKLALSMYFGPCTPYQYRVMGPGAWPGARQTILTTWQRVVAPFQTRTVKTKHHRSPLLRLAVILLLLVLLAIFIKWL